MRLNKNKSRKRLSVHQEPLSIENIKSHLNHTADLKVREIKRHRQIYTIVYINTLVDQETFESKIIEPLTDIKDNDIMNELYSQEVIPTRSLEKAIDALLDGYCLIIENEKSKEGLLVKTPASLDREITEPVIEKTIQGANVGFVESIDKNIYLLRKTTRSPSFTVKNYTLGNSTKTNVCLIYLKNKADPQTIKEVDQRIRSMTIDSVRSSGDIAENIEDNVFTPFPQLMTTERPDRVSANLKDGRVVLLVDGSPVSIILPATFMTFFQTPDDYVTRWGLGTFFRLVRLWSYINALILPSLYVALVSFHYEIIPVELVYSFQSSLSYVPFPPIIELMILQFSLELLREASIRLPPSIATTFGIVGAVVVGTAMVDAGFVSYGGLIIVAITSVSSFVQPNIEMSSSIRVLGFPLMILASIFGLVGICLGLLCILIHLSRLTSYGILYFTPFAPLNMADFRDTIIRVPTWMMKQNSFKNKNKNNKQSRKWKLDESKEPY